MAGPPWYDPPDGPSFGPGARTDWSLAPIPGRLRGPSMNWLDRLRKKSTIEEFARLLIRALRAAGETAELRYEAAEGRILRFRDGELAGAIHLDNLYRTYLEKPRAERPAYLKTCVRAALTDRRELPEDFDAARPDLRPKLWTRA